MTPLFSAIIAVLVLGFWGTMTVAAVTYVRRTLQLMRAESDEDVHRRLEDGVERLGLQVSLVLERLERLELDGGSAAHRLRPGRRSEGPEPNRDAEALEDDLD